MKPGPRSKVYTLIQGCDGSACGAASARNAGARGCRGLGWDSGISSRNISRSSKPQSKGEGVLASDFSRLFGQAQEEEDAMKVAARKIGGGGFTAAKSLLEGKLAAPPTEATKDEIAWQRQASTRRNGAKQSFNVHTLVEPL